MALAFGIAFAQGCGGGEPAGADAGPSERDSGISDAGPGEDADVRDGGACMTGPLVGSYEAMDQPVDWEDFPWPAVPWAEVPVWTVRTSTASWHSFSTALSFHCMASGSIFDATGLSSSDCEVVTSGHTWLSDDGSLGDEPGELPYDQAWRRDYYGIFTAHVRDVGGNERYFGVLHGEHKNYVNLQGVPMQGVINPDVRVEDCPGDVDEDCDDAYNGFIGLVWADVADLSGAPTADDLNDLGPILWPHFGYTAGGHKSSLGLRHPHGFVTDGWLYIFYLDTSLDDWPAGVHVARARLDDAHVPGAFVTWDGSDWQRSLPPGFEASRIYDFVGQLGGESVPVVRSAEDYQVSFAVAETNEGSFIGVEEYVGPGGWGVRLRRSDDLIHWSDPVLQLATEESYAQSTLGYPVFWSATGSTHERIDVEDFWVHGTRHEDFAMGRVRVRCLGR